jgi:hypothetical protein
MNGTGGGGAGGSAYYGSGGNGGSGIVIIRYRRIPTKTSCIELINGTTTDTNTDYTLGNYNGIFKVFAKVENLSNEVLSIDQTTLKLGVPYGITTNSTITGSIRSNGILYADYGIIGTGNIQTTGNIYTQNGTITGGNVSVSGTINTATLNVVSANCSGDNVVSGSSYINGNSFQRNTYIYSGNESTGIGLYFATPFTGSATGATKSAIIAEPISSYSRHHLAFCMNRKNNNSENVTTSEVYFRMHQDDYIEVYKQLRVYNEIFGGFYSVTNTDTDYLCIMGNYGANNAYSSRWIKVAFGSFTAFHRCYTDDELYNNETDEDIDIFKNNFIGRVVIATGKIKTDFSRTTEAPKDPDEVEEDKAKREENEWYSEIDKDGINIEDAVPVVRLSRKKKDKRVFGVFGGAKRNTNNKNRLIVNSVGEGAICVSNTNGNIENGDYIQSSDLLGYGEKQDDDLLHNYTIGKATIDCNFELDSPYYQCHEIENGVRVAFIACSYHCG